MKQNNFKNLNISNIHDIKKIVNNKIKQNKEFNEICNELTSLNKLSIIENIENMLTKIFTKFCNLEADFNDNNDIIKELNDEIIKINKHNVSLVSETNLLNNENLNLNKKYRELDENYKIIYEEYEIIKKRLSEFETKSKMRNSENERKIKTLKKTITGNTTISKDREIIKLENLKEVNEKCIKELHEIIEKLKLNNIQLKKQSNDQIVQIEQFETINTSLNQEIYDLKEEIKKLNLDNNKYYTIKNLFNDGDQNIVENNSILSLSKDLIKNNKQPDNDNLVKTIKNLCNSVASKEESILISKLNSNKDNELLNFSENSTDNFDNFDNLNNNNIFQDQSFNVDGNDKYFKIKEIGNLIKQSFIEIKNNKDLNIDFNSTVNTYSQNIKNILYNKFGIQNLDNKINDYNPRLKNISELNLIIDINIFNYFKKDFFNTYSYSKNDNFFFKLIVGNIDIENYNLDKINLLEDFKNLYNKYTILNKENIILESIKESFNNKINLSSYLKENKETIELQNKFLKQKENNDKTLIKFNKLFEKYNLLIKKYSDLKKFLKNNIK